ncbi:MAG TPA: alternative ribosome rescue aminoacyl-tRNA hydrolase ArfB [Tepidisphaeraceae bacterium]|nr:alternative ribosome rescue aminoacyl-tRNA hydrolase ArfB [Tepidisphaeraceae bacterium]
MSDLSDSSRIELAPGVHIASDALHIQYTRSSGPGGQNVNKLNTRSELWIVVDDIVGMTAGGMARLRRLAGKRLTRDGRIHLVAQTERSQERNRAAVMDRLRLMIETAMIEPKPRRATKPSRAAKRRRLDSKRRRGEIKAGRKSAGHED